MSWTRAIAYDAPPVGAAPGAGKPFLRLAGEIDAAARREDLDVYRYLLFLRFVLTNAIATALLGAAAGQGWVDRVLTAEGSGYTLAIAAVFAAGLAWSGHAALQISRALNQVKRFGNDRAAPRPEYIRLIEGRDGQSRAILASSLRLKLAGRIAPVRHIANSLVLLGLVGTVIGFIIALSGVRPETVSDVGAIGQTVSTLIGGMSVALYTTLVGSVLHLWLMVNVRLLEGGSIKLLTSTVDLGERHAGA